MLDRISRRNILAGAVATAGVTLAGVTRAAADSSKLQWDETVDVIVVGSGFAGLAAAIEARKAGANVIVLEKMPTLGGNSIINGGIMSATSCPEQKYNKIEDSPELLAKDMMVAGNYLNDPEKVNLLAHSALSNYE